MNVGESVRESLKTQGRDIRWLSNELNVSRQRAHALANSIDANTRTVQKLAKIFGFEVSEFIALGE